MFLRALLVLLAAPWAMCWGAWRGLVHLVHLPRRLRAMGAGTLTCPSGHVNSVMGRWTCSCGAVYLGHAFGPCPVCGMPAGWISCARCGLTIRSPWTDG